MSGQLLMVASADGSLALEHCRLGMERPHEPSPVLHDMWAGKLAKLSTRYVTHLRFAESPSFY